MMEFVYYVSTYVRSDFLCFGYPWFLVIASIDWMNEKQLVYYALQNEFCFLLHTMDSRYFNQVSTPPILSHESKSLVNTNECSSCIKASRHKSRQVFQKVNRISLEDQPG